MKRVTVSLPDDIADRLEAVGNVSAYVAEALRAKMDDRTLRQVMEDRGLRITDSGVDRAREYLQRRRTQWQDQKASGR